MFCTGCDLSELPLFSTRSTLFSHCVRDKRDPRFSSRVNSCKFAQISRATTTSSCFEAVEEQQCFVFRLSMRSLITKSASFICPQLLAPPLGRIYFKSPRPTAALYEIHRKHDVSLPIVFIHMLASVSHTWMASISWPEVTVQWPVERLWSWSPVHIGSHRARGNQFFSVFIRIFIYPLSQPCVISRSAKNERKPSAE